MFAFYNFICYNLPIKYLEELAMNNKREQILKYVEHEIETKNHIPTIKEICNAVNIKPIPTIQNYLSKF
jgi:hypothetical protein